VFEPNRNVTRAEFITMLGRLHEYGNETIGIPGVGTFYERYLEWAVELGIMHGNQYGDLMPQAYINREQMAVIVYRYITEFELWSYFSVRGFARAFSDERDVSSWAWGPIEKLRLSRVLRGGSGFNFRPQDNVSRAEAVATLTRIGLAVYDLIHPMLGQTNVITEDYLMARFNISPHNGNEFNGYAFRLIDSAIGTVTFEGTDRIWGGDFGTFLAKTLQDIIDYVDIEIIQFIGRNYIIEILR